MKAWLAVAAILLLAGKPTRAHRLDEYLQGVIFSVEERHVQAQIRLIPGVAVLPTVLAAIDTDANGVISETEKRAYATQVLRDLTLTIDGHSLTPQLLSLQFPAMEDMKEGGGEIQIEFAADLPRGGPHRRLIFKNDHESRIAAYQVNCLVPRDPNIRIVAQNRNYSQSVYQVEYEQAGLSSDWFSLTWWSADRGWLGAVAFLLFARFAWLWRYRGGKTQSRIPVGEGLQES